MNVLILAPFGADGEVPWIRVQAPPAGSPQRGKAPVRDRPKRRTPLKQPPDIHHAAPANPESLRTHRF